MLTDRTESVWTGTRFAGLHYNTELVSAQGVRCTLYRHPDTTREEVARAKREARNTRDVVSFSVVTIERPKGERNENH